MIISVLLTLVQAVASAVSVLLNVIPLPAWFSDGTVAGVFEPLRGYIWGSPAPHYLDLAFAFDAFYAWWGIKLALIPARWVIAIARRWAGPMLPNIRTDAQMTAVDMSNRAALRNERARDTESDPD